MIIGIDASCLAQKERTGIENSVYEIILALARVDDSNQYLLYTPKPLPRELVLNANFKAKILPGIRFWRNTMLPIELKLHRPDCLFLPSSGVPIGISAKTVVMIHDLAVKYFPDAYSPKEKRLQEISLRRTARLARHVVFASESARSDFLRYFKYPKERTTVIPLGYRPMETGNTSLKPKIEKPYFLFIGRLEERKNVRRIIEAFKRFLIETKSPYKLVLAGKNGYGHLRIQEEISRLEDIGERIITTGYVSDGDKSNYLQHAEALLYPSLYEGFGLNILEAFAHNIPVVTSNLSAMPEVAGDAALTVDPFNVEEIAQAMVRIQKGDVSRDGLVSRGKARLRLYSWQKCAEKFRDVFMKM